jgi:hypothetical protein
MAASDSHILETIGRTYTLVDCGSSSREEIPESLRRGRKHRYDNVARAVLKAVPELLAPEMKVVYDPKFIDCLSAHIARSLLKDYRTVVTAINDFVASKIETDEELRKVLSMLVEIDDQSLLSRILLPELVDVAKLRYPHRDPQIDYEVLNLVETLYKLVRGEALMPVICGKYLGWCLSE